MSWQPAKCVVPVDFSPESLAAVDRAIKIVEDAARVYVIHVLPLFLASEPGMVWDTVDDKARRLHAREALARRLAKPGHERIHLAVTVGDPGEEIAAYAVDNGAELIVLPSHGRTGIRRLLIGSTTERVVRLAHCPVLVLKE